MIASRTAGPQYWRGRHLPILPCQGVHGSGLDNGEICLRRPLVIAARQTPDHPSTDGIRTRFLMVASQTQTPRDLLYRGLFEHALVEVHMWQVVRDASGNIVTWKLVDANPNALQSWGKTLHEVVGLTTDEIFPGVGASDTFMPIVKQIMATGTPREWEIEFPVTNQILHMVSFPVGEFFVSTGFDVTAQRKQEQTLRHTLDSLTQATSAAGVGLWDWDLHTNHVMYSDEWKRQLGHEPHEIADNFDEWKRRVHPDDLEPTLKVIQELLQSPRPQYTTTFRMRHKDGSYRWILAQSTVFVRADGQAVRMLGSHIDVTERRRVEEQLLKSQKLESVGTLAAGIAHDFNNLLTAISGNVSLLKNAAPHAAPSAAERETLLTEVEEAARRAKSLTSQLLTFAKGGAPVPQVASIRDVIVDSASFVSRGSRSRCEFAVDADLKNVHADIDQISQVIENLVINASQAMPDGGTITVSASNIVMHRRNEWDLAPGDFVKVSVSDQGYGIDEQHLPRIFDPFYTTKSTGSGLGLSTAYSIIGRHGGQLTVESQLGCGSTFTFYLPASNAQASQREQGDVVSGSGRLLVMDDDPQLRRLMKRLLERLGYECDTTEDGNEAVAHYVQADRDGRPYAAVILDLTIPGKEGGRETLARLRDLNPDVIAVVASGYADDDLLSASDKYGFNGRLKKPMDLATLSSEVARVLQETVRTT